MNEEIQNKIMPKFRFPEFENTGEWMEKAMESIAPLQRGFDLPSDKIKHGDIPVVYSNGIRNLHDTGMAKGPGIVTGRSGTIGEIHFIPEGDYWPHNTSLWVTSFKGNSPEFIYFLYKWINLKRFSSGSGVPTLNRNDVHAFQILIPSSVEEQQKIADCLSSLDELITAQSQKLEALKAHKKGLMQQLFPAEGETVPQLRFAEFRDSVEWEEKTLIDVAEFLKGKGISKADIDANGTQPCIRYGQLYTYYKETISTVISFTNLLSDDLVLSQANDVIIPSSGETREDIATASCVMKSDIALGGDLNIIRSKINGVFMAYYLTNCKKNSIAKLAQGDAVVHLYSSQLQKLKINFPLAQAEQQKIADCISSLDELITAQTEKIEALKTHKKGLMQGLFPSPEGA